MAKVLGKGLEALIKNYNTEENKQYLIGQIPIAKISPNNNQPRQTFATEQMNELINSIQEKGVIQPITVTENTKNNSYEIIAGERRFRASKALGLQWIPAYTIKINSKSEMMELALIENIQRVDLSAIEEGEGYAMLSGKYNLTHKEIALKISKSRSEISNKMRLLNLPPIIKDSIRNKTLTYGHARSLITLRKSSNIIQLYYHIINKKLSVRQTEKLAKQYQNKKKRNQIIIPQNFNLLKSKIVKYLDTKVDIAIKPNKTGIIKINFSTLKELKQLIKKIIQ